MLTVNPSLRQNLVVRLNSPQGISISSPWDAGFLPIEVILQYEGPLPSAQSSNAKRRRRTKERMQRIFHEQLMNVWKTVMPLRKFWDGAGRFHFPQEKLPNLEPPAWNSRRIGKNFWFVPLVMTGRYLKLICKLEVGLLSRDEPGMIVNGGDLDNRVKVLLDALTLPQPNAWKRRKPRADEMPVFCLLEDDHLITEFSVKTSRLHRPLRKGEKATDVELRITATVDASDQSAWPLNPSLL